MTSRTLWWPQKSHRARNEMTATILAVVHLGGMGIDGTPTSAAPFEDGLLTFWVCNSSFKTLANHLIGVHMAHR